MTGRHRHTRTTPARRALLAAVPLIGGAGVVTVLLAGAIPDTAGPAVPATVTLPGAVTAPGTFASGPLPGRGEATMDAVAGARDAVRAHETAGARAAARVSTVAEELRRQAADRAERARAAGDAELAAYLDEEAARQERAAAPSRPVVHAPRSPDPHGPAPDGPAPRSPTDDRPAPEPGEDCRATDLLRLGPLTVAGEGCDDAPWVTGQVRDTTG
ncbi:hypothetical protein H7X46_13165 [Pseudonocardia sp. C8]|uniref:hypothetical protein n=1 Tax=Pseudonocardia sp. C8 TaxID=2762759 RepID=UPI001642615B|nr:hypothetical protein [Pseudonocardia sp. C8]MBC3192016.1 hypothetical protein [Pseudonocardia sp. C8]